MTTSVTTRPAIDALTVLGLLIAVLAVIAAGTGLFWPSASGPLTATSVNGETVDLYGRGLYHLDTRFAGAGARGADAVTLALGVPLLLVTLVLRHQGSLRGSLLLSGALTWFLYVYASVALGTVIYNALFLVYVALFSASLFALGLALREARGGLDAAGVTGKLPRRGPAAFLFASGLVTLVVWLGPLLSALASGRPPERLDIYTGRVTAALDLGVITPSVFLAGVLVLRGKPTGFAAAIPLFVLEAFLLPMIAAQTVSQIEAGVAFSVPEMVGPMGGFVALAAVSLWMLTAILRRVPGQVRSANMQQPGARAGTGALVMLATLAATGSAVPAAAQPASQSESWDAAAERFAGKTFPALADSFAVPGAVLAVVQGDSVLALEGYGYADLAAQWPADPERTLFRVASVSKPVTATVVLRLWERGAFHLHADVNRYLERIAVPEDFGAPVTAHHLLTHTAGFDEKLFGGGAPDAPPNLTAYLAATLPGRVYPPGLLHSYSNHGYGLLGVLVEERSGQSFEAFVEEAVFAPLGMTSSTFRQPPPEVLRERLATGYVCTAGDCTPLPYDYVAFGPAGALQTTAADMVRFLSFHLSSTGGALADTTRRRMHAPQWQPHAALGGMGYGFFRGLVGRYEALRHAGGWPGWSSQMVLVPEADLGYFVAANTDAHLFLDALLKRFAADVLGGPLPPPAAAPYAERLGRYAGTYRLARHVHHGVDKIAVLAGMPMPDLRIEAPGDTALVAVVGEARERLYATEVRGVFIRPGLDPRRYVFETDAEGRVVRMHTDYASLERVAWWEARRVSLWVLGACFVVFASAVGAWFVSRLRRRRRERPRALRRVRTLAAAASACHLAFALGLAAALVVLGAQGVFHPFPWWVRALFALPLVGAVLGLLTLPAAVRVWRRRLGPWWSRVHYTAVALAAVAILPLLMYWNLLGFNI